MDFKELINLRQSTRKYDTGRDVEDEKLERILEAARLSPSACNAQPYHLTVCRGEVKDRVARACMGMGINSFAKDAPIAIIISEAAYSATAALGAKIKSNDYRSIDIGIVAAYITSMATEEGLGSCILGWFDNDKIKAAADINGTVRLVITIGYPDKEDMLRTKKRKDTNELISYK